MEQKDLNGITAEAVVIGTGAAGYQAAVQLKKHGVKDVLIVTEGVLRGTSRNTGSDKQTYYKLGMCGETPDSPAQMAEDLFAGHGVDGDTAYAEAALSARCFLHLAEAGVPFPVNRYGEYVGYRTDHDSRMRATSAGPLTSKQMTECLQAEAKALNVSVLDGVQVLSVLKDKDGVVGLIGLRLMPKKGESRFAVIRSGNIVAATGGPAGIYSRSVYPEGHWGSSGMLFEAGVFGKNLTEWQYGLASVSPRWNVSGTYMQVLPRFVSVDEAGVQREFLREYFKNDGKALSLVFQKGYQWPFDSRKAAQGSSLIDLLVYRESVLLRRKVYLDFKENPGGAAALDFSVLSEEAKAYLEKARACFGTPIQRLLHMNQPAYELYLEKGVDLKQEMLEIALCAQHNNGGAEVDLWWQTCVPGLYVVGEAAGTHGVYRPGGSALNAGQVGALRAAQRIARYPRAAASIQQFERIAGNALEEMSARCTKIFSEESTVEDLLCSVREGMDAAAGPIRRKAAMAKQLSLVEMLLEQFDQKVRIKNEQELSAVFRLREVLLSQRMYLRAMVDYVRQGGTSRGSAIYPIAEGNIQGSMDQLFPFEQAADPFEDQTQITAWGETSCTCTFRPVRPLPSGGGVFETVWKQFREDGNIR